MEANTEQVPVAVSECDQSLDPTADTNSLPALIDVIGIIPERCYRNPTAKGLAYVVRSFFFMGLLWQHCLSQIRGGFSFRSG